MNSRYTNIELHNNQIIISKKEHETSKVYFFLISVVQIYTVLNIFVFSILFDTTFHFISSL